MSSDLPPDDPERVALHDEVHTRPTPRVRLPARVLMIAVLNDGIPREAELDHLRALPGVTQEVPSCADGSYLRLKLGGGGSLRWERHTEFTRYTWVQALAVAATPADAAAGSPPVHATSGPTPPSPPAEAHWRSTIPGRTIAAVELVMVEAPIDDAAAALRQGSAWLTPGTVVASLLGRGHSCAVTDFRLRDDGFERIVVLAPPGTTQTRAGRIAARLLELEIYRLMALRGLPVAKQLQPLLAQAEVQLAEITESMEHRQGSDEALLDTLVGLAAGIERATARHGYRFAATQAYHGIVQARIAELREQPIPGTQTIGEFMRRRLSPAMATVEATSDRLATLSQRIERAGALLRTRVDIAREVQNQELLARLARGQTLQLRLQSTVEGLSIAAISYYVISLLLYAGKAAKLAGLPIQPELAAGSAIPLVVWGVWRITRRIHQRLHRDD